MTDNDLKKATDELRKRVSAMSRKEREELARKGRELVEDGWRKSCQERIDRIQKRPRCEF